jgi:hypothetical protein
MLKGDSPGDSPAPPGPCLLCKGNHWRSKCLCLQMKGEVSPPMDWWVPAPCPCSTSWCLCWGASWWQLWWKTKDHFPSRTVELISLFYLSLPVPGPMTKVIVRGKPGQPLECYFTWPLACSLRDLLFCHSFLIVPETPVSLMGQDLLSQLKTQILLHPGSYFCCPLLQEQRDSTVWTDEMSVGQARLALPTQIKPLNPSQFPHPKQYPLKPEGQWCFIPIINFLKQQGQLISCSSPYNKFKILIKVNFKIQVTK